MLAREPALQRLPWAALLLWPLRRVAQRVQPPAEALPRAAVALLLLLLLALLLVPPALLQSGGQSQAWRLGTAEGLQLALLVAALRLLVLLPVLLHVCLHLHWLIACS